MRRGCVERRRERNGSRGSIIDAGFINVGIIDVGIIGVGDPSGTTDGIIGVDGDDHLFEGDGNVALVSGAEEE